MAKVGCNWARIWATSWDDRNPFFGEHETKVKDGWISEQSMDRWEPIIRAAEEDGIAFQFVFFYHGLFSTTVNPNWQLHPWNKANGGFLADPKEFFTNAEAKRRSKLYLRYVVARWGYSSAIMAWELFNEVQFTDQARSGDWKLVGAWHDEMADYLRSIDPYHHLITTSSELGAPIWKRMDYLQGHGYPASVAAMLLATPVPTDRPMFFGEVGPGDRGKDADRMALRDGIWAGLLAGHAGAGQYWYWDVMDKPGMYDEIQRASEIFQSLGPISGFRPLVAKLDVETGGDLTIRPGRGWEATTKLAFQLPGEATPDKTGQLSTFLQGTGHREMQSGPIEFRFVGKSPSKFRLNLGQASRNGAALKVSVDGAVVVEKSWKAGDQEVTVNETLDLDLPNGTKRVQIENEGKDWVTVSSYEFTGIAPLATCVLAGSPKFWVARIQAAAKGVSATLHVGGLPDRTGGTIFDLAVSKSAKLPSSKNGSISFQTLSTDQILVIPR
jgi:hypothetical protein